MNATCVDNYLRTLGSGRDGCGTYCSNRTRRDGLLCVYCNTSFTVVHTRLGSVSLPSPQPWSSRNRTTKFGRADATVATKRARMLNCAKARGMDKNMIDIISDLLCPNNFSMSELTPDCGQTTFNADFFYRRFHKNIQAPPLPLVRLPSHSGERREAECRTNAGSAATNHAAQSWC